MQTIVIYQAKAIVATNGSPGLGAKETGTIIYLNNKERDAPESVDYAIDSFIVPEICVPEVDLVTENVEEYPADYNLDEMDEIIEELINNESSVTTDNTADAFPL